ncbi:uncharacterized protein LOC109539888 [Dendroctonus ponderosae]
MKHTSKLSIFYGLAILALEAPCILAENSQGNIVLTGIEKCEVDGPMPIPWEFELNNADGDGHKKFDAKLDFTAFDFNDQLTYKLTVDRLSEGEWENKSNQEGNLCDVVKKYAMKAWDNMMNIITPRPIAACTAQKEIFVLKDFEITKPELQIPPIFGQLRAILNIYDKNENHVFCASIELEVSDE